MFQKPDYFATKHAEVFQHRGIAAAYQYRPPYSSEVFDTLVDLMHGTPRRVLDVGSGTGNIARLLIDCKDCMGNAREIVRIIHMQTSVV